MRPVRLSAQNFMGIKRASLDFRGLWGRAFALVGPNGSGKSSLLEAVVFALYGKGLRVKREVRTLARLEGAGSSSLVELVFEASGRLLSVRRRMDWTRGGWVAVLEEVEPMGDGFVPRVCLASRVQEVERRLCGILGIDHEVFSRSVLLPQGELMQVLELDAQSRRRMLSQLTDLGKLKAVGEILSEEIRRLEGERSSLEGSLRELDSILRGEDEARLREMRSRLEGALRRASSLKVRASAALDGVRSLRERERRLEALEEEISSSRRRLKELSLGRYLEVHRRLSALKKGVETLGRALDLALSEGLVGEMDASMAEMARAKALLERCLEELRALDGAMASRSSRAKALEGELSARVRSLLGEEVGLEEGLGLLEELSARLKAEESGLREELDRARRGEALLGALSAKRLELEGVSGRVLEGSRRLEGLRDRALGLEGELRALRARLEAEERGLERAQAFLQRTAPLREEMRSLEDGLRRCRDQEERLRGELKSDYPRAHGPLWGELVRVREEIFRLREGLAEGLPSSLLEILREVARRRGTCPVCGSRFAHGPASGDSDHISFSAPGRVDGLALSGGERLFAEERRLSEELRALRARFREKGRLYLETVEERAKLERRLSELKRCYREACDEAGVLEQLKGFRTLDDFLGSLRSRRDELALRLKGLEEEERALALELERGSSELEGLVRRRDELEREVASLEAELSGFGPFRAPSEVEGDLRELLRRADGVSKALLSLREGRGILRTLGEEVEGLRARREALEGEVLRLEVEIEALGERFLRGMRRLSELLGFRPSEEELRGAGGVGPYIRGLWESRRAELREAELERSLLVESLRGEGLRLRGLEGERDRLKEEVFGLREEVARELGWLRGDLGAKEALLSRLVEGMDRSLRSLSALLERYGERVKRAEELRAKREERASRLRELEGEISYLKSFQRALSSFEVYASESLFEAVLDRANELLEERVGGRFKVLVGSEARQLVRRLGDDSSKREGQLYVLDERRGKVVSPEELSGGERTLLALSMALGLADVAFARVGFLFLDEALSMLDSSNLNGVVELIKGLAAEGDRIIGVVTHDEDLAGALPHVLEMEDGVIKGERTRDLWLSPGEA